MQKNQRHRRLLFLILIPPILAICLCLGFSLPRLVSFLNSPAFPDYLWSQHITRALSDKGYSVRDSANVARSERPVIDIVALEINDLVNGEQKRPYELVKEVHSVVMETFANTAPQPQPVDIIFVVVNNKSGDSYAVEMDFEDVQKFQAGEISEQTYFEHWILHPKTLEITPP
jgi:hypothetical protein